MPEFKIDENMPIEAAHMLAAAGQDAMTVSEQGMKGKADVRVAAVCQQERRVVVTPDLDFGNVRSYPPEDYPGVIVLRLARLAKPRVLSVLRRILPLLERDVLTGKLWIVEESSIRIRG